MVNIYNREAEKVDEVELNSHIFSVKPNMELIHQALMAQMSNSRKVLAHAKGRSEVRGGGKKPWEQKGTGRARHGSIRSPLWIGGGITFGPSKERNFEVKINKKAKKKALRMLLTDKVVNQKFILLDELEMEGKTKAMTRLINNFSEKLNDKKALKALVAHAGKAGNLIRAGRNIEKLKIIGVNNLNIKDLLEYEYFFLPKDGLATIENLYSNRIAKLK
ncbi:MAG: 50S ribosomal protein L4 [bacterium]